MKKQKIFFLILFLGFLLFQNTFFISSQSCISSLSIDIGIYETKHAEDDSKFYMRSSYQPSASDKFVRQSDTLFIEKVFAKAKPSCQGGNAVIQFKRPNSEEWGEDITLNIYFPYASEYSFELASIPKFSSIIYKDLDGNDVNPPSRKTLSEEGLWEFRVTGVDGKVDVVNDRWRIPGEIVVMDRIATTQLETLRQLNEDSQKSSRNSLFIVILIGGATIFFMWFFHRREEKRMIKREEEKQLDLLEILFSELTFLEKNLEGYKKTFSGKGYPLWELWNINTFYFKDLNHKIKNKEIISLKEDLMVIKDKLAIVNNLEIETKNLERERGSEKGMKDFIKIGRENIIKRIDEDLLPIIKKSKKFIEKILK